MTTHIISYVHEGTRYAGFREADTPEAAMAALQASADSNSVTISDVMSHESESAYKEYVAAQEGS